ncbi:alpha/beta hydrolase [Clostridia bacterium]|nr:alpha/beta hydrolase [Clostridia bacterium]GHV32758.1 alpha/beta hydrolase [Clostridia bacterium]
MRENIRQAKHFPERIDFNPKVPLVKTDWIREKKPDVSYGEDKLQKMDIYYPNDAGNKPYPVLLLVHGGGFVMGDKRDWHSYPGFFALDEGFALASVNYRLSPPAVFPEPIDDVKNAVLYLRRHAAELGVDGENIFLYGTSAGGNIVTFAGVEGEGSRGTAEDFHVNGVAALCPLVNFQTHFTQLTLIARLYYKVMFALFKFNYLGKNGLKNPEKTREASADTNIGKYKRLPPFYIQHGDRDPGVSIKQSEELYAKLKAAGLGENDLIFDTIKGASHAGAGPHFIEAEHVTPIFEFFKRHLV